MQTSRLWSVSFVLICLLLLSALFPSYTRADILWRHTSTGQNAVWYMNGETLISGVLLPNCGDLNWKIAGVVDFNADGKPDILWRNSATGQNAVWFMNGETLISGVLLPNCGDLNWKIVGVVDFNADGKPDILWRNSATGQNAVWYMNGETLIAGALLPNCGDLNWNIVGVVDFNADGKPDLLWRNTSTGQNAVWYMNGETLIAGALLPNCGDLNWKIVGVVDFNADGKPDLLWRNTSTGQNAVWYMNGETLIAGVLLPNCGDSNWKIVGFVPAAVTGTVKAPGGTVAFYPKPGLIEKIAKIFSSSAQAALSGISNVADGTVVELVRIDSAGNPLATIATTAVTGGTYFFNLANLHVGYASDLIVQVRNAATGAKMRAFVNSGTANIDPVSEALVRAVLEKIAAVAGTIASFTPQEIFTLASSLDYLTTLKQAFASSSIDATATGLKNLLTADPALSSYLTSASAPGQTTEMPGDVGDYFPMSVGNAWEYSVTTAETGKSTQSYRDVVQITGTTSYNGSSARVFQEYDPARGVLGEDYRTKTGAGIIYYGNNDSSDTITTAIDPYMEAQFPLQTGSSFVQINKARLDYGQDLDGDGINETLAVYSTVTVLGFESVSVDAGSFQNCLKLQTAITTTVYLTGYNMQVPMTATATEWYASGVGLVKRYTSESSTGYSRTENYILAAYNADGHHLFTPTVLWGQPDNGASVMNAATVTARVAQAMDPPSINVSTFTLKDSGNNLIAGTVSYQYPTATFTPSSPLPPGTYTATISTGARDIYGMPLVSPYSWTFTIDRTPPTIVSITPAANAVNVSIGAAITVTFSEEMNSDTIIDSSSLFVWSNTTGQKVAGGFSYSNKTATFTGYLEKNMSYSATVKSSVKDVAGNALGSDYTWSFTTAAGAELFLPWTNEGGDTSGRAVAIGDMNGDGLNDVVMFACPTDSAAIDIFLQNGSGGLASPVQYSLNINCSNSMIAIGDVNHDGRNDIVVSSSMYGSNIQVFLQNASGGLNPGITYTTNDSIVVRIADVNNDGLLDIVGIGSATNTVSIWYQNSGGGLNTPITYPVSHPGWQNGGTDDLALGDINNDGLMDIIVMNGDRNTDIALGVLTQKGDGTFNQAVYYNRASTYGRTAVAVGDLNGDHLNDVVLYSQDSSTSKIVVFTQNGQGGLNPAVSYDSSNGSTIVQVADMNGDGLKDVIVAHPNFYYVGVSLQQPDGTLSAEDLYRCPVNFFTSGALAIGDINNDGLNDVAIVLGNYLGLGVLYHTPPATGLQR